MMNKELSVCEKREEKKIAIGCDSSIEGGEAREKEKWFCGTKSNQVKASDGESE